MASPINSGSVFESPLYPINDCLLNIMDTGKTPQFPNQMISMVYYSHFTGLSAAVICNTYRKMTEEPPSTSGGFVDRLKPTI